MNLTDIILNLEEYLINTLLDKNELSESEFHDYIDRYFDKLVMTKSYPDGKKIFNFFNELYFNCLNLCD